MFMVERLVDKTARSSRLGDNATILRTSIDINEPLRALGVSAKLEIGSLFLDKKKSMVFINTGTRHSFKRANINHAVRFKIKL